ncbi:MAG: nicotinamide-nucleotide amidohydrolase family protein, partial [Nocardioidaceae bacterium]|nr:nicotinamide-nucleotide amidohydrolase family protein [Nocardioidaceae bacterium]
VPGELLDRVGAVSEEVAIAMAQGACRRLGTTYGIATTGVAGPGGGTPAKPVGLVHLAVATESRIVHRELRLSGDRDQVRRDTVTHACQLLLDVLTDPASGSTA